MDEPPPSYYEAVSGGPSNAPPQTPARPPQPRPHLAAPAPAPAPAPSPRPRPSSYSPDAPSNQNLYSNNESLPFSFPRGSLCPKCKNTGYKLKNGQICKDCWMKYYIKSTAYNPNPNLPFKYPKKFLCEKCNNTGRKVKNGKTCQDCYERFAPRNSYQAVSSYHSSPFDIFGGTQTLTTYVPAQPQYHPMGGPPMGPPMGMGPPQPPMMGGYAPMGFGPPQPPRPSAPIRVNPGDPRIGGVLCGRCRGSGMVHFFLDEELCPVCQGVGRILNSSKPPQHYQPPPPPQRKY